MIPAGKYIASPKGVPEMGHTKNKNTPFIRVTFSVLEGDFKGETVEWTGWLTDKAKPYAEKSLNALGWDGKWDPPVSLSADHQAEIVVEHEEYPQGSGKIYARVRWVNELPLDRYAVKQHKQYGLPPEGEDDDIPF